MGESAASACMAAWPFDPPNPMPPPAPMSLSTFNGLPQEQAEEVLRACCGCARWASSIAGQRPLGSRDALLAEAEACWNSLSREEWLEAFSHHPRIGETTLSRFGATADTSRREQSGMTLASDHMRGAFLELNQEYEHRFGHVFLICATGKSAE